MGLTVAELRTLFTADDSDIARTQRRIRSDTQRTQGVLQTATGTMAGFLGANVIQNGASRAFDILKESVWGFNDQLDRSELAFTTMLGNGRKARAFLDDLKTFAKNTPFEFSGLVDSSQQLLAMGFRSKEILPTLTAVGDAVAGLGGDPQKLDRVIIALGQIKAKGKASAEEIMQLTEAGIPAWDMLARKLGVTIPEAMALVTKGQVDATTTITAVTQGMEQKFGGLMEKQSRTASGALSNVKDSATQTLAQGFRPLFDEGKKGLIELADNLSDAAVQGDLVGKLEGFSDDLIRNAKDLAPILEDVGHGLGLAYELGSKALELFDSLPGPVKSTAVELLLAYGAVGKLNGIMGEGGFLANLRNGETRMDTLRSAAKNLAGGAGVMLLTKSLSEADETTQTFQRTLGGAAAGFAIGGPVGAAAGAIGGFATALLDGNEATKDSTQSMIDYGEAIDGVTGKLKKNALQSVISSTKTENPDLFKAGGALGISDEQIGRAIMGNQKAQAAIAETIRLAQKAGTVPLVPVEMEDGAKGAVDAVNLLNQALNGTITETGDGTRAVDGLVASFAEQRAEIAANAKKVRDYKAAIDGLPKKVTTLLTNDTSGDVSLKTIKDLAEKYDKTPKEVVTLLELEGYKLTVDNLKAVGLTMRQIDRLTAKPKVSTEAIDRAVNSVKNLLRLLGGAGSGGSGGGGGGGGAGSGGQGGGAPRRSGRGTSRALLADALAGFETEGSKLDILEERRTIRDLQRDLRERKKVKNKKGKGYHLGGYVLTGLDRQIAQTQLAEARKELQRLMGKAVDQEAIDAAASIADQLKQTQSLFGTGTTSATQGLKNLLTNQVTNQEWLKLLAGLSSGGASAALLEEFRRQGPSKQSLALGNSILASGLIGQYNQALGTLGSQQAQIGAMGAAGGQVSGRALVNIETYQANDKSAGEIASELYFRAGVER